MNEAREIKREVIPETDDHGAFQWRTKTRVDRFSHGDLKAWLELNWLNLKPWEMAAVSLLDEAYVRAFNGAGTQPIVSERPLSSSLFKALFGNK